jgi:site-specific DNA-cytosine methylase
MRFRLNAHTKANIKQRIQDRETTWTLDTSKGKFSVYDNGWRDLTLSEKEQLQGFPTGWCNSHRQIGNAVTVPVVQDIISSLVTNSDNSIHA